MKSPFRRTLLLITGERLILLDRWEMKYRTTFVYSRNYSCTAVMRRITVILCAISALLRDAMDINKKKYHSHHYFCNKK
jgi:hypothetical protein